MVLIKYRVSYNKDTVSFPLTGFGEIKLCAAFFSLTLDKPVDIKKEKNYTRQVREK